MGYGISPVTRISIHALHEESDGLETKQDNNTTLISIHALHEESDLSNQQTMQLADIFQSTLSMRRATGVRGFQHFIPAISIHALHEESDHATISTPILPSYFNPRSP